MSRSSTEGSVDGTPFPLPELTTAALLDLIVVSFIWDLVRLATLIPVSPRPWLAAAIVLGKAALCELVPFLLLRRGHLRPAVWLLGSSAMVLSAVYVVFSGGLRSSSISIEIGLVTAAVVLLGSRSALAFGALMTLFVTALAWAEVQDFLPAPYFVESVAVRYLNLFTAITVAAIPAGRAITRLQGLSTVHSDALRRLDAEHRLLKQSQEQLRAEREHLRTILDSEPECVKLVSRSGICLDINPAGLAMIELDSADLVIGRKVTSLLDPEFRQPFEELHAQVFDGCGGTMKYSVTGARGTHRCWRPTLRRYEMPLGT